MMPAGDEACGGKKPDGALGTDVLTDVVVEIIGGGKCRTKKV